MRTLFVTQDAPGTGSGRALRVYGIVRALARFGPVDLLFPQRPGMETGEEFRRIDGVTLHPVAPSRGPRRALTFATHRARGVPAGFARGASPELTAAALRLAAAPGCDHVVADGPTCAAALRPLGDRVTYNAHNLESQLRAAIGGMGSPRQLERFERRLLERVGESWMVSAADLDGARRLAPRARLRLVPNVVDAEAIDPPPLPGPDAPARVLLLADWTYPPNVEAGRFLLDEVLPLLRDRHPDAVLTLAGRDAAGALRLAPDAATDLGVELPGFVPDVRDLYARATCVAVPLLTGGGSPLKFVEALAHGRTVVSTSRGAAGLAGDARRDYIVADGAPQFAAALGQVLAAGGDPTTAAHARELALAEYSISSIVGRLGRWAGAG